MGDVVNLKNKEPMMWICHCGCRSFVLMDDGTAECTNCEDVASSGQWHVVDETETEIEREAFRQTIVDSITPHIVLNDALKRVGEIAAIAVIYAGVKEFRVWDRPIDEDEQAALPAALDTIVNKIKARI